MTEDDQITYKKVYFTDGDESKNLYQRILSNGNRLKLSGRDIVVYRNKEIIETISVPFKSFAPEYPYIVQFS